MPDPREVLANLVEDALGIFRTSVEQYYAELLTSVTTDDVGSPQTFLQHTREALQYLVSGKVPVGVIHPFETVQVDHGKAEALRNFGITAEGIPEIGTNAKMGELHALMGSLLLGGLGEAIEKRRGLCQAYRLGLADVAGIRFADLPAESVRYNYAYMPIEIDAKQFGLSRDELWNKLKEYNIFARPYFYPVLTDFECYKSAKCADDLVRSRQAAEQVLCLPLSSEMERGTAEKICEVIRCVRRDFEM